MTCVSARAEMVWGVHALRPCRLQVPQVKAYSGRPSACRQLVFTMGRPQPAQNKSPEKGFSVGGVPGFLAEISGRPGEEGSREETPGFPGRKVFPALSAGERTRFFNSVWVRFHVSSSMMGGWVPGTTTQFSRRTAL